MPQSLTQLPKEIDVDIDHMWHVPIKNHLIERPDYLLYTVTCVIDSPRTDKNTLFQFEAFGVNYESFTVACSDILKNDPVGSLCRVLFFHYGMCNYLTDMPNGQSERRHDLIFRLLKSRLGKIYADILVEKIRSCDNWDDLYEEMHHTSKFHKYMRGRIEEEIICHKV